MPGCEDGGTLCVSRAHPVVFSETLPGLFVHPYGAAAVALLSLSYVFFGSAFTRRRLDHHPEPRHRPRLPDLAHLRTPRPPHPSEPNPEEGPAAHGNHQHDPETAPPGRERSHGHARNPARQSRPTGIRAHFAAMRTIVGTRCVERRTPTEGDRSVPAAPACSPAPPGSLPSVDHQVTRLVDLGVHDLAGMSELEIRTSVAPEEGTVDALVAISPARMAVVDRSRCAIDRLSGATHRWSRRRQSRSR